MKSWGTTKRKRTKEEKSALDRKREEVRMERVTKENRKAKSKGTRRWCTRRVRKITSQSLKDLRWITEEKQTPYHPED